MATFRTSKKAGFSLSSTMRFNNMASKNWIIALLTLCSCNKDVENVSIHVRVIDKVTHKPLSGVPLLVEAAYYHGGNNDSYNGYEKTRLTTNSNGEFEARFSRIAYIQIKVAKASTDTLLFESDIVKEKNEISIEL